MYFHRQENATFEVHPEALFKKKKKKNPSLCSKGKKTDTKEIWEKSGKKKEKNTKIEVL